MAKKPISVAAPRKERYDEYDKANRIVVWDVDRRHPENPAYRSPAGEVCICEGQGVKGDPGKQEAPWLVYPSAKITALISAGRLVEVRQGDDTRELRLKEDDLRTLDIGARAVKALEHRHVEGVADLASKVREVPDPIEWLSSIQGIGARSAADILAQLEARGLYG